MKVLVVLSGGMDSTVALAALLRQGHACGAVTYHYGSKHNDAENAAARRVGEHYGLVDHRWIDLGAVFASFKSNLLRSGGDIPEGHYAEESMKRTVVPYRNGILLAIAGGLAASGGYEAIAVGSHQGDHTIYPDCRTEWVEAFGEALTLGTWERVQLLRPVQHLDKAGIARLGLELGAPLALTHTCYNGCTPGCGRCGSCVERAEAFALVGATDPAL